ncbi:hypothetical protein [Paraburkholderia atlantica]|uniref:hypothetical protein n=1 Tax=Paraburkholderia atlantica TaxID=2654982 RepID=UPI0016133C14|nr:hypothetical protein [Paraburkholderia atlantica]MBB5510628.1 hypothetical protein [Paraburkholderia atlantica]
MKFLVGRWQTPWASDPFLKIRIAIEIDARSVVMVHHLVERAWRRFGQDENAYVRELIIEEIDAIVECPEDYGLKATDAIPAAWSDAESTALLELPEDDEEVNADDRSEDACVCCDRWYRDGAVSECEGP